jgi:small conductance mechanosensitive channel
MPEEIISEVLDTATLTWTELVLAIVILVSSVLVARLIRRTARSFLEHRPDVAQNTAETVGRISGWVVILVGIVGSLIVLGFQMGPLVLLLLIVAVMVAISGRRILENWASGLSLQVMTPFVIGDRIETEGIVGWVEEINAREVVLTSRDRRTIRVPNTTVINSVIYNFTEDQQRRTEMGFGVSYDNDPVLAERVTSAAVAELDLVHPEPAPVAYVETIGDDGYEFLIRFYHDDESRKPVRTQAAKAIVDALTAAGISMPTPELAITELPPPTTETPS